MALSDFSEDRPWISATKAHSSLPSLGLKPSTSCQAWTGEAMLNIVMTEVQSVVSCGSQTQKPEGTCTTHCHSHTVWAECGKQEGTPVTEGAYHLRIP